MKDAIVLFIFLMFGLSLSQCVYSADTNIRYKDQPPPSAHSPSISIGSGNLVCVVARSGAIGTGIFSASTGFHVTDRNCERILLSRQLQKLGLSVSVTAILCQDDRVFEAMAMAGSPCPYMGKVGKEATAMWIKIGRLNEDNTINRTYSVPVAIRNRTGIGQPTE